MPFVQDTTTPATSPTIVPATDLSPEVATEAKPEAKAESGPDALTITKTEAVTTRLAPESSSDGFLLWMWLPLAIMLGIWLFLRGRNQAAERARADALLATASKKSKKPARSQTAEFRADDETSSVVKAAGERSGKGNSKKFKKDKQQQRKKQQANAGVDTGNANRTPASAIAIVAAEAVKPIRAKANEPSVATAATAAAPERKAIAPVPQAAKAIFEPLRRVTSPARVENVDSDFEADKSLEQEFAPNRKRRSSTPPPVITTPAKVSSGRFEKLNVPPANAGLGAATASRWPSEAARPLAPTQAPQPMVSSRAESTTAEAARTVTPAPVTARGLAAFVKVAKTTETTDSATDDSAETQADSNNA